MLTRTHNFISVSQMTTDIPVYTRTQDIEYHRWPRICSVFRIVKIRSLFPLSWLNELVTHISWWELRLFNIQLRSTRVHSSFSGVCFSHLILVFFKFFFLFEERLRFLFWTNSYIYPCVKIAKNTHKTCTKKIIH